MALLEDPWHSVFEVALHPYHRPCSQVPSSTVRCSLAYHARQSEGESGASRVIFYIRLHKNGLVITPWETRKRSSFESSGLFDFQEVAGPL